MRDNLVEQIISEVMHKQTDDRANNKTPASFIGCGLTEFVGTALGHTIGLVIANVDHQLHEVMNIDKKYRSIGILGARTGAGPHIFAADEAIKATNSEILSIELARDTEGGIPGKTGWCQPTFSSSRTCWLMIPFSLITLFFFRHSL